MIFTLPRGIGIKASGKNTAAIFVFSLFSVRDRRIPPVFPNAAKIFQPCPAGCRSLSAYPFKPPATALFTIVSRIQTNRITTGNTANTMAAYSSVKLETVWASSLNS